jgi:hypothetical protein
MAHQSNLNHSFNFQKRDISCEKLHGFLVPKESLGSALNHEAGQTRHQLNELSFKCQASSFFDYRPPQ